MTLTGLLNNQYSIIQNADFFFRLLFSFVVGGLVGRERSKRFKEAGMRTHMIVCCTTTLLMIVSKYGFADLAAGGGIESYGTRGADAARIAAQAVSGISFLCAGVIFKVGGSIKGLTTAAGIWLTASLGLAIGAGMYFPVIGTLILLWANQYIIRRLPFATDAHGGNHLEFKVKNGTHFNEALHEQLKVWDALVTQSTVTRNAEEGTTDYDLLLHRKEDLTYTQVREFVDSLGDTVISFSTSTLYANIK